MDLLRLVVENLNFRSIYFMLSRPLQVNPKVYLKVLIMSFTFLVLSVDANQYRSEKELVELKDKISQLQSSLSSEREKESKLATVLQVLEKRKHRLSKEKINSNEELEDLRASQILTNAQLFRLEEGALRARKRLSDIVLSSFLLERNDGLQLLLSKDDPVETDRYIALHRYVITAKKRELGRIRVEKNQIAETLVELEKQNLVIQSVIASLATNERDLEAVESNRKVQLKRIRSKLSKDEERIRVFRSEEEKLLRLLESLRRESTINATDESQQVNFTNGKIASTKENITSQTSNNKNPVSGKSINADFGENRGRLKMPVQAKIVRKFGQVRPESGLKWDGLMLRANQGQSVTAIFDGQVVFSDWFGSYGQLLVLDHGDGYMSLYGHNELLHVSLGGAVRIGDTISSAGDTGGLNEPGLYFEIRHNGIPTDPLAWCRL